MDSQLVRSTGDTLDLRLVSAVETVLQGHTLHLENLMLTPGRQCQN